MGTGSLGAKAHGLASIKEILKSKIAPSFEPIIKFDIPRLTVIATDFFDLFMEQNNLFEIICAELDDVQIALAFQRAELPGQLIDDLRVFIAQVRYPLAIRSSSLLEDSMHEPFAGVYATKMIPNNQPDPEDRLRKLAGAIKFIYASTYFKKAKDYLRATKHSCKDEKMAVIIQEMAGTCRNNRFYPHISGVARSFNFYPMGLSLPENGVVDLALGLGKIIVDNGLSWSFSPAYPHTNPPYNSLRDLLKQTQNDFWAIDMSESGEFRPVDETEYLKKYALAEAEKDGTMTFIASTFKAEDERISMGISEPGPRILDFAPILKADLIPLANLLKDSLRICEEALHTMVEIEFAVNLSDDPGKPHEFAFLQMRPLVLGSELQEIEIENVDLQNALCVSNKALGNGFIRNVYDLVYVRKEQFDRARTIKIAEELGNINAMLKQQKRPYLLIGPRRWGSADPWLGIPVKWAQISAARCIIETGFEDMQVDPSQGSHFFQNIMSFGIGYFTIDLHMKTKDDLDTSWLNLQPAETETEYLRHIAFKDPLHIALNGRKNLGVVMKPSQQ